MSALRDWYQDVLEFHKKFGCKIGAFPSVPDRDTVLLRESLVYEEVENELFQALEGNDLPGIADACVDSIYVIIGLAISYGIDLRPVWAAVQEANMAKTGGKVRSDGKILKPEGWQPPDVLGIILEQISSGNYEHTEGLSIAEEHQQAIEKRRENLWRPKYEHENSVPSEGEQEIL